MSEVIGVFRHETVEKLSQIASRRWVGIFHNDNAATGVLNKNGDCSVLDRAVADLRVHVIGDFVEVLAIGTHFEVIMVDVHFQACYSACEGKTRRDRLGAPVKVAHASRLRTLECASETPLTVAVRMDDLRFYASLRMTFGRWRRNGSVI